MFLRRVSHDGDYPPWHFRSIRRRNANKMVRMLKKAKKKERKK